MRVIPKKKLRHAGNSETGKCENAGTLIFGACFRDVFGGLIGFSKALQRVLEDFRRVSGKLRRAKGSKVNSEAFQEVSKLQLISEA